MWWLQKSPLPLLAGLLALVSGDAGAQDGRNPRAQYIEQNWTDADRSLFYGTSGGSQIMPHAWFRALERAGSGEAFIGDGLSRYGFLPLAGNPDRLPLGFTIDRDRLGFWTGIGCAACHTGEIRFDDTVIRIDGAPAQADIQSFAADLADALDATVAERDSARFRRFAEAAMRHGNEEPDEAGADRLFERVRAFARTWRARVEASADGAAWGHGRADALARSVQEIRLRTGGGDSDALEDAAPAGAPVSLPHLWGTSARSHGMWTGSAPTDTLLGRLVRNGGDMFAFFATAPLSPDAPYFPSSIRHFNLLRLEEPLARLWSPQWREDLLGPIDWEAAERGERLYDEHCASCHERVPHGGQALEVAVRTEAIANGAGGGVGTDDLRAAFGCAGRVDSGRLAGHILAGSDEALANPVPVPELLDHVADGLLLSPLSHGSSVPGTALFRGADGNGEPLAASLDRLDTRQAVDGPLFEDIDALAARLREEVADKRPAAGDCGIDSPLMRYRAGTLDGVWATAPYLHNGSVASLRELLLPAAERMKVFSVGSTDFDPVTVGFDPSPADGRTLFDTSRPGNSNAGHDTYGNHGFSEADRHALVEYLKTL